MMIAEIVAVSLLMAGVLGLLALLRPRDPLRKQKAIAVMQAMVWVARVQKVQSQIIPKTLPAVDASGHEGTSPSQR
jgi:hypothetical protein